MQHVLTASNSEVLRLLGSRACARLGLARHVVASGSEALAAARNLKPRLVILDADMPESDGCEVCRAVKQDSALAGCRVMLVLSGILNRATLDRLAAAGCDDVLVMPAVAEEFFAHLADLLEVPRRRRRRVAVELLARLDAGPRVFEGQVQNLSLTGAKVRLTEALAEVDSVRVRLTRERDGAAVLADARVVWRRDDSREVGLEFGHLSEEARRHIEALVLWDVVEEDGRQRVFLEGDFNESATFGGLAARLGDQVDFDAAGVRYINSHGSRLWCAFLRGLERVQSYTFSRCSVAFTTQAGLVPGFLGRGRVVSFHAPYHCDQCDRDEVRLLQTAALVAEDGPPATPSFQCPACHGSLVLDEIPERFFAFVPRG
ncbi:MAG: PilZ domain-containing protein [Deltaproteobacteria bacterium]|nr:PilZ domain-containing protein [Deltaproteobacteria bacterium]